MDWAVRILGLIVVFLLLGGLNMGMKGESKQPSVSRMHAPVFRGLAPKVGGTSSGVQSWCASPSVQRSIAEMPDPTELPAPTGYPEVNLGFPSLWRVYSWPAPKHLLEYPTDEERRKKRVSTHFSAPLFNVDLEGRRWEGARMEALLVPEPRSARFRLDVRQGSSAHRGFLPESRALLSRCLANKTVVVAGNSLARQLVFALHRLVTGIRTLRSRQKAECKYSCGMFLPGPSHVVFVQALRLWMDDRKDFNKEGMHTAKVALGLPFGTFPDVLVVGFGHQDAFEPGDFEPLLLKLTCFLRDLATKHGVRIFYRTATPLRKFYTTGFFGNGSNIRLINDRLRKINQRAREMLNNSGVSVLDEEALGLSAFEQKADDVVYEDHIHAPPIATEVLRQLFEHLC